MDRNELEKAIIDTLDDNEFGSFGTIEGEKKPKVRYMAVYHEGLNIHLATDRKTHKVEELEANPYVCLLLGFEAGGSKDLLEIEATAVVTKDETLREKVWNKQLKKWFDGPDDPNYVILDLAPTRIEYRSRHGKTGVWESLEKINV
ncbi:MAG: pyridoxamine 5'-phosphate oxidase family protein [Gorillibacterium sp.]|nr:pyridoxamine 5'-phosphate oxidase family protein [Gorillibacterium sp.]